MTFSRFPLAFCCCLASCLALAAQGTGSDSRSQQLPVGSIVLPPWLVAGQPATLGVLDTQGRLVPGATVELLGGRKVRTNETGRAIFTAPPAIRAFLAKSADGSVTAAAANGKMKPASGIEVTQVPSFVSLRDRFVVRGRGFRGDADANHVTLGGEAALILAASPESLVLLPSRKTSPGPAKVAIEVAGAAIAVPIRVVAFEFGQGGLSIPPEKKSRLSVRAVGTDLPLDVEVQNLSPGTIHFPSGDRERLKTLGGADNVAVFDVQGVAAGDFSFGVRLLGDPALAPDIDAARQFLSAAIEVAPDRYKSRLTGLMRRLERRPKGASNVESELETIVRELPQDEVDFWLNAARAALLNP